MRSSTTQPSGSVHRQSKLSVCDQALSTAPAQTHTSCWWGGAPNLTLTARLVQATAWACISSSTPSSQMTQAVTLSGPAGVETVKFPNCSGCRLLGWRKARRGRSVTVTEYRTNVLQAAIYSLARQAPQRPCQGLAAPCDFRCRGSPQVHTARRRRLCASMAQRSGNVP